MGIRFSKDTKTTDIFEKEMTGINHLVNSIINENDTFRRKEYNFLSDQVCAKYQVVLQSELSKHLKVHLTDLGDSMFLIPKGDNDAGKINMTKTQVCEQISNHYVKVLYILCVIKYIYNIGNNGNDSFGGRVFRNIRIVDNMLEILYCDTNQVAHDIAPRTSVGTANKKHERKLDFDVMDGFKFFSKYILSPSESRSFMKIMRKILGRESKNAVKDAICEAANTETLSKEEMNIFETLFKRNFGEQLNCKKGANIHPTLDELHSTSANTHVFIDKHNPVLSNQYCSAVDTRVVSLNTKEGKELKKLYYEMKERLSKNLQRIESIIRRLVTKTSDGFELNNISSTHLDQIIEDTKISIRLFILQSLLDYQHMLNMVKNIPNVKISVDSNGLFGRK